MAQQKFEFFNEDQIEVLKGMFENEWSAFHPSDILSNIIGYLPSTITATFLSDVDEDGNDVDLIAITYSDYTNQPLGMAEAEFKKDLEKFVTELKKVFKEVTGKALTVTERDENPNVNRSYWKTSMHTEMFHYELVYEYSFPEDFWTDTFSYDKKDPADDIEFKYDEKMNTKYSEKFDEDLGYDDLELLTEEGSKEENSKKKYIEVVDSDTNEVVHKIDVTDKTERQIDRVEDGININLNHEKYYTRLSEDLGYDDLEVLTELNVTNCPDCGARLKYDSDSDAFFCKVCGWDEELEKCPNCGAIDSYVNGKCENCRIKE